MNKKNIKPVIVAIAKKEQPYIEEWVRWHIALGFDHIYLYDNEDTPTYENLLQRYSEFVSVMYLPGNNYIHYDYKFNHNKAVQYVALEDFVINHRMTENNNTHAIHIDIDEFIVLKQHNNIKDFIKEFFVEDCGAIGINWRFFGDSGQQEYSPDPVVSRFIKRQKEGDQHIKTLFDIRYFDCFGNSHYVNLNNGLKTKTTNKKHINGPFNHEYDFNYIQINHYKSKTYHEFSEIINRLRVDLPIYSQSPIANTDTIQNIFNTYNYNEEIDLCAYNYLSTVDSFWNKYFSTNK
jgi:hypothetical protein